ncbi:MAG: oligosaccharide flippase family protein [Candidatus Amulumruptor caecigallinarius]|nr:oligosaccharide flippase family protein [Candidatus Amulumruptor caecigallinarius]MCM1397675.1 oligosaccharide flippase family protein [Candidatus Amulumruptor caecigallinarius]MCM1454696.1 oligosaccharide flippase family protein [bacterium]
MAGTKSLFKDTAIYGMSSIVGRFLNWCLVPLYTIMFPAAEYGVVTYIYSIVALALIILIYGMETGFFRFANHDRYKDPMEVYSTTLISLGVTSTLFVVLLAVFLPQATEAMQCAGHPDYVMIMGIAVAIDAFTAIPFSYLRFRHRPLRFATLKLIGIGLNIGLNLWFILVCPWLAEQNEWFDKIYDPGYGIGYIFLANLVGSAVTLLLLIPELRGFPWKFNRALWREMLAYSAPLLVLGVAGIMNQTVDKILYPWLAPDKSTAMQELGIYGANYKIAIIMVMFIQAFRFAYEPFIFSKERGEGSDRRRAYADAMKYFVIFAMVIFLGVMYYLDVLKYFISPRYFSGLKVVPVVMMAEFFFGVFFNLSVWYKLTDRTVWGMWYSLGGLAVTLTLNIVLVPRMGYMGCAWAAFSCYALMMAASYVMGRSRYPIDYKPVRLGGYVGLAMALWCAGAMITTGHHVADMALRTPLLLLYIYVVLRCEHLTLKSLIPHRKHG